MYLGVLLLSRETCPRAAALLICCFAALPCFLGSIHYSGQVNEFGKSKLAQHSQYMVDAIQAFDKEIGSRPLALTELAPDYLRPSPAAGQIAYSRFEYIPGPGTCGNWILGIRIDRYHPLKGFLMYRPDERYIQKADGYSNQEVGRWAFRTSIF
jgi:hypothetical protein